MSDSDSEEEVLTQDQVALFKKINDRRISLSQNLDGESDNKDTSENTSDNVSKDESFLDRVKKEANGHWNEDLLSDKDEEPETPEGPEDDYETKDDNDDGIPSFDEDEAPSSPLPCPPKAKKLTKKKRLSNEDISKFFDSGESDFANSPLKVKKCEPKIPEPKAQKLPLNRTLKPELKRLSSRELADIVNQPSPDRKLKVIEALPQPPRYAKLRGISESVSTSKPAGNYRKEPEASTSKWFSKKFVSKPAEPEISKKNLKVLRKEKLEQLALKQKAVKDTQQDQTCRQPVTKQISKVKQSLPKTAKLLEPFGNAPKPTANKRAFERALSMSDEQPLRKMAKKRRHSAENSDENQSERDRKRKLSTDEKSKSADALPPSSKTVEKKKSVKSAVDDEAMDTAEPLRKKQKRISWADEKLNKPLVEIREIPKENIGRSAKQASNISELMHMPNPNVTPEAKNTTQNVRQPLQRHNFNVAKPVEIAKEGKCFGMNDVMFRMLNWNVAWLEEQKKITVSIFKRDFQ